MSRPQRLSLAHRLLLASLLTLVLALPLAGMGLTQHFRTTATAAFDERLTALLNVVIAGLAWEPSQQRLVHERSLGDPRFEQVFSGWYWQISDGAERVLTSRSLWDQRLPVRSHREAMILDLTGPRDTPLRVIERDIRLAAVDGPLHVSVAVSRAALDAELARFSERVTLFLVGLGVLLLATLALQIHWGLAPLRRMQNDLQRVENGDAERLDTRLSPELARLAQAMNGVLDRDRRLMAHARHAAGNLAHALKTPVSVLTTLIEDVEEPRRTRLRDELARLDDALRHHLARASAAGNAGLASRVDAGEALAPIVEGLGRLAERRGLRLEDYLPNTLRVRMEAQDLQELIGNLLDNALRWAEGRVELRGGHDGEGSWLTVEDDGPGMDESQRQAALARGTRLDEQRPGSGLGLAIVADLVKLYGGRLTLDRSSLGGLAVRIWLPDRLLQPDG